MTDAALPASPYTIPGATHRLVEVGDVTLSVYEQGDGGSHPPVIFSHGFPELAFTWRHQLGAVADAGFRAVAPDQRGYGGSSRPAAVEDYDIFHLTGDLVGLLDDLGAERGIFVGHDWGGFIVWQMPLLHPERTAGVVGLNTPFTPRFPMRPTELFRMVGGDNFYIVWFQTPGEADAKLAANTAAVFERLLRRGVDPAALDVRAVSAMGDFVEMILEGPELGEPFLTDDERATFVDTFLATGFTGGINWYRNFDRNWELTPDQDGARIDGVPCLMITAGWDPVLRPEMAAGMPSLIGDLEMHEIPTSGHWTQQEAPDEVNRILTDWLVRRF